MSSTVRHCFGDLQGKIIMCCVAVPLKLECTFESVETLLEMLLLTQGPESLHF